MIEPIVLGGFYEKYQQKRPFKIRSYPDQS